MEDNNFEDFFQEIRMPLRIMVRRLNGHHQELDDEDLFQEASIHLWQRFCNNELVDKNKSYILKSCYFNLKNYLRNKSFSYRLTSLEEPIDDSGTTLKDVLPCEKGLNGDSDELEKSLLIEGIKKCGLTSREKEVLELFLQDLTTREIAKQLNVSHVRVVKLMASIKARYKKWSIHGQACGTQISTNIQKACHSATSAVVRLRRT